MGTGMARGNGGAGWRVVGKIWRWREAGVRRRLSLVWGLKPMSRVWCADRSGQDGGVGAGWRMTVARLGGGWAGFDETKGQRSKPGMREDVPWFPESR